MTERIVGEGYVCLSVSTDEDGERRIDAFYTSEGFIEPELLRLVERAIREYPVMDARQWLGGVSAIHEIEDWIIERAHSPHPGSQP